MAPGRAATADSFSATQLRDGKAVTARLLSRALGIHLDEARKELAKYAEANAEAVCATYLISGRLRPSPAQRSTHHVKEVHESRLEASSSSGTSQSGQRGYAEAVSRTAMLLVPSEELSTIGSRFDGELSKQLYSLSPVIKRRASELGDGKVSAAGLDPATISQLISLGVQVREIGLDNVKPDFGCIALDGVQQVEAKSMPAGLSAPSHPSVQKATLAARAPSATIKKEQTETGLSTSAAAKKAPGGLSWSKAKPQQTPSAASKKRKGLLPDSEDDDEYESQDMDQYVEDAEAASRDAEQEKIGYSMTTDGDTEMASDQTKVFNIATSSASKTAEQRPATLRKKKEGGKRVKKQRVIVRKVKTKNAKGYTEMREEQGYESYSTQESESDADVEASVSKNAPAEAVAKTTKARDVGSGSSVKPQARNEDRRPESSSSIEGSSAAQERQGRTFAPHASAATNTTQNSAASSGNAKKKPGQQKLSAFFSKPK
ncbi:hypothetical protein IE81DRAFT_93352 [Ceraceosorus guamensis]|uniref:DNA polymerase delta subunit 3 n=1 Tax=Ceraceosorus guamensis TaxID=1522189 RepID=A0A316W016_9BASI|nr:hypothetical protein IE81DRAFT_93352 [Ceraceosorus guamensis]PWN43257.1 hypothetical protein IE81DRAFT_93352 [Ceraceosorus guamensis]